MLMEENRRIRSSNSFRIFIWRIIKISGGEEVQSMLIPVVVGWVPAGRILRPRRRCRKEVDQRIRSLQNRKAAVECHRLERCQGLWRHFQCSKDLLRPFAFGLLYAQIDGWHGTAVSDVFKKIIQLFSSFKKKIFKFVWYLVNPPGSHDANENYHKDASANDSSPPVYLFKFIHF